MQPFYYLQNNLWQVRWSADVFMSVIKLLVKWNKFNRTSIFRSYLNGSVVQLLNWTYNVNKLEQASTVQQFWQVQRANLLWHWWILERLTDNKLHEKPFSISQAATCGHTGILNLTDILLQHLVVEVPKRTKNAVARQGINPNPGL
jgi:hypothetical protein